MPRLLILLLVLAGCGDPLSNGLFDEDDLFTEALPQESDLQHSAPEAGEPDEERAVGDEAFMPRTARDVATSINGSVYQLLSTLDDVRSLPITTRERDRRIWGPYPWLDGSVRMTVERSAEALFAYRVESAAEAPDADISAWYTLMDGEFLRGESLRDGDGSFEFDAELWNVLHGELGGGRLAVVHSRAGEDVTLRVAFSDWLDEQGGRNELRYFFRRLPPGGGVFEYRTPADIVGGPDSVPERWTVRVRWLRGGAGRADFLIRAGDLGDGEFRGTECWDRELRVVYYDVDGDELEADGAEASCPFTREDPREIEEG